MKVKEIIVVEGVHDSQKIKSFVECDTLETNGSAITKERIALIAALQKRRGVIIFTDPDAPGERIRALINEAVPGCKNAFIEKKKARTTRKVGVEHANQTDIMEALSHLMTFDKQKDEVLSWQAFTRLGLNGQADSAKRREILGNALFVGRCNAKTLWKRLNMLEVDEATLHKLCQEYFPGK